MTKSERFAVAVGLAMADGHSIPDIAKVLVTKTKYPDDPPKRLARRRKMMRQRLRTLASTNEHTRLIISEAVTGQMVAALPEITDALIKRAKRGRPDAIKLIFEATGYYNPKVQHEHTGDIKITLDIPRPAAVDPEMKGDNVVDADVVEEPDLASG